MIMLGLMVLWPLDLLAQEPKHRQIVKSGPGRFQIVNGTPDMARNIMLLDTETGDAWVACEDQNKPDDSQPHYVDPASTGHRWCFIPKDYKTEQEYDAMARLSGQTDVSPLNQTDLNWGSEVLG